MFISLNFYLLDITCLFTKDVECYDSREFYRYFIIYMQFQLEDANNRSSDTTAYIRRPSSGSNVPRPSSAPVDTITASTAETTVTLPLRRPSKPPEDKGKVYFLFIAGKRGFYLCIIKNFLYYMGISWMLNKSAL